MTYSIVAHRGATSYATDNTITSYRLAHAQGAKFIELDIRRSADGKPVVFHTDPALTTYLVDSLREARWLDRCILFGPRPDHVFFVREIAPEAQTAFSYRNASIDPLLIAQACNATGLNLAWEDYPDPCALITPGWLARVRAAGLRIMSWHEEREPVMRQLVALGIEDLCTNDPAMTRRVIEAAGSK